MIPDYNAFRLSVTIINDGNSILVVLYMARIFFGYR